MFLFSGPPARVLACSARRAGPAFLGAVARPSSRSWSGAVFVARFSSPAVAGRFASVWSTRLGLPVFVRSGPGPSWSASVPVPLPPLPGPVALPWRGPGGGPAAFWRALRALGV